ncbi:sodium-independent anion transporter [Oerskovia sp. M15]
MLRFSAPVFFANAAMFQERATEAVAPADGPTARVLIIDAEGITDVDVTGSTSINAVLDRCDELGVLVLATRLRVDLAETLAGYGLLERLEVFDTNAAAVDAVS